MTVTVYVSIGNSDDRLTQREWAEYTISVDQLVSATSVGRGTIHGAWLSAPDAQWQNACWCVEFDPTLPITTSDGRVLPRLDWLRERLARLAARHRQDSIALAIAADTEFIRPAGAG